MNYGAGVEERHAHRLGARYAALAKTMGVAFLDAGAVIHCSDLDGKWPKVLLVAPPPTARAEEIDVAGFVALAREAAKLGERA